MKKTAALLIGLMCALTTTSAMSAGSAEAVTKFGFWTLDQGTNYVEAYTVNDSNATLGMLCTTTCLNYVDFRVGCEDASTYSVLISSDVGAAATDVTCTHLGGRTFYVFQSTDVITQILAKGTVIGFAQALATGRFNVSRFSLEGSRQAIGKALDIAVQRKNASGATGFGNSTM